MKCSAERLIEALIAVDAARERRAAEDHARQQRQASYVVTVSRGYGALGGDLAEALADRMEVRACDRNILEAVAARADVDVELVERLDENVRHAGIEPWKYLFRGKAFGEERYIKHLVTVVMNIARQGGVILGRGAHLILGPERAFRVRIVGSLDACARRVAERENVDLAAACSKVSEIDGQRSAYIEQLYGVDRGDCSVYDLVINSDRFSVEQMVNLVLHAMRSAGYDIPDAQFKCD